MSRTITGALDLGTTKVRAVITEILENGDQNILGYGIVKSQGMYKGMVTNITKTAEAIKEAVRLAVENSSVPVDIKSFYVGIAGEHIKSIIHRNHVLIQNLAHEVGPEDIARLEAEVRAIKIAPDQEILHVIQEEFQIDDEITVEDPLGVSAYKLGAVNHVVLALVNPLNNIRKAVDRAGYKVKSLILQPLASAQAVLNEDERDIGVLLLDIGGGTTDVALFHRKSIRYSRVFGIAGNMVTNDIRETLGVVTENAEKLKIEYGCAHERAIIKQDEMIMIQGIGAYGNSQIPISLLAQIIGARMKELFTIIDNDLKQTKMKKKIKAGIIITGGGSMLRGITDLAEEVFGISAQLGLPAEKLALGKDELQKPEFSTVLGLLKGDPSSGTVSLGTITPAEEKAVEEPAQAVNVKEKMKKEKTPGAELDSSWVKKRWDDLKEFFNHLK